MYPWLSSIFDSLLLRYGQNKLHHGLIFMGASELGKTQLCKALAASLLCKQNTIGQNQSVSAMNISSACGECKSCLLIEANSHPDLNTIISDKSQIGIDLIRNAITKLNQTAQLSGNKVLIIPNIELMSESASNSLLKTLEEPTKNTFLLMTTNESQKLLPTVLSRCEKIKVAVPSFEDSALWLQTQGIQVPSEDALQACGFSPIRYAEELKTSDSLGYEDFTQDISLLKNKASSSLSIAQKWKDDLPRALQWLSQHFMSKYKSDSNESDFENYQACIEMSKHMSHPGLNKVIQIEALLSRV